MTKQQFIEYHRFNDKGIVNLYTELMDKFTLLLEQRKYKFSKTYKFMFNKYTMELGKLVFYSKEFKRMEASESWIEINNIVNQATIDYNLMVEYLSKIDK